jgi:hypothetical protein
LHLGRIKRPVTPHLAEKPFYLGCGRELSQAGILEVVSRKLIRVDCVGVAPRSFCGAVGIPR